jgi:hypothetical protein
MVTCYKHTSTSSTKNSKCQRTILSSFCFLFHCLFLSPFLYTYFLSLQFSAGLASFSGHIKKQNGATCSVRELRHRSNSLFNAEVPSNARRDKIRLSYGCPCSSYSIYCWRCRCKVRVQQSAIWE